MKELGISHVMIANDQPITYAKIRNPNWEPPMRPPTRGVGMMQPPGQRPKPVEDKNNPRMLDVKSYQFKVQFLWKPTRASQRLEARRNPESSEEATDELGTEGL